MFVSSPACRSSEAPSEDNSQSEPVGISARFNRYSSVHSVRQRDPQIDGGNDQKRVLHPVEPGAQEVLKEKFAITPTANAGGTYSIVAEKNRRPDIVDSCAAMVIDDSGSSAFGASDEKLTHSLCRQLAWPSHTDACWNDPRWSEKNQEKREKLAQKIQSGFYCDSPVRQFTVMSSDQRYKTELAVYASRKKDYSGYSNIRIVRCEDASIVANINRNIQHLLYSRFYWNGDECVLTGHSYTSPLVVNLNTEKIYQQRGDQYDSWELIWHSVKASPDGRTFLAEGLVWGGFPDEYRFYDASKPDQGFRFLPSGLIMVIPDDMEATLPQWGVDENGQTTVSLTIKKGYDEDDCVDESGGPVVLKKTFRREEDRMVEVASETMSILTDISAGESAGESSCESAGESSCESAGEDN